MTTCDHIDDLRDYAMGEASADARAAMEQHLAAFSDCTAELCALRLTTAALRTLPDREMPQRIAFVSDKIFEPSPVARFFANFWNSAARLGFASACVLSAAVILSVYHRPAADLDAARLAPARLMPASLSKSDVDQEINAAVSKAVAQVRDQVREEDAAMSARTTAAALAASDRKHEQEHRALLVAMEENLTVMQKRLTTFTMLASNDAAIFGGRQ
jgi:hypothetical protein